MFLLALIKEVHHIMEKIDYFMSCHFYMERNVHAYKLSKKGIQLSFGHWKITEVHNRTFFITTIGFLLRGRILLQISL